MYFHVLGHFLFPKGEHAGSPLQLQFSKGEHVGSPLQLQPTHGNHKGVQPTT
ncbi:MAG: hypothetical protein KAI83_07355 [Thiomargarita sp.]|nr:hypothetical protein [Thiomargarita sp.]